MQSSSHIMNSLILIGVTFLVFPLATHAQTGLGRSAADEAIGHIAGRCEFRASCMKHFGLNPKSTPENTRKSKLSIGQIYEICETGYGTGRKDGLVACINYLRGW